MNRAMFFTVLARMDGQDTTGGDTWYSRAMDWAKTAGISDGTNPDGSITREQLATMLWRYAGSPSTTGTLDGFTDATAAGSYATDALKWGWSRASSPARVAASSTPRARPPAPKCLQCSCGILRRTDFASRYRG